MKQHPAKMILLILVFTLHLKAQYNVNRDWQNNSGSPLINPLVNPAGLNWSSTITDVSGNIITTAHTNVSGQGENMYLEKLAADGSLLFSLNRNTTGSQNDYGIAVTTDAANNIYVAGTTDNGGTSNYDVVVWAFDASGNPLGTYTYAGSAGLNDIASSIKIDPSGNMLVACSSENVSTSYDYKVLKYNTSGSLLWSSTYDYANLIDVPLAIDVSGSTVVVAGASASLPQRWDYCVANFDLSTGAYLSNTRTNITGIGFDQPLAFKKDAAQNIYLTGKASTNGVDYDVLTVKINSGFTIDWIQSYNFAGGEDVGNAIDVDASGNVMVGGYSTKSNGVKQATILKYSPTGSLLWKYHQSSRLETADAFVKGLCSNTNGDSYFVAGETGLSNKKEVITGRMSSTGDLSWERSIKSNNDNVPSGISLNTNGTILVSSVLSGSMPSYQITEYNELVFNSNVIVNNGKALCKQNELIVRFNASVLNTAAIDNQSGTKLAEFGSLSDFMNTTPYNTLRSALKDICPDCDIKAVKIFKDLPTTYTSSVSRLGQTVPVPDLWTALLLCFPTGVNIKQVQDVFNTLPGVILYSHPNYIAKFANGANDPYYSANQIGMHNTGSPPAANINVEEAWDIIPSGGLPFIKCGVFDTGIYWEHDDFGYNGLASSSKVIDGWDFKTNTPLKSGPGEAMSLHGTGVAGIIGAIRNNGLVTAGVAGGNYTMTPSNKGVSLYGIRLGDNVPLQVAGLFSLTINYIADAIRTSAVNNPTVNYAYGLHLSNHSWQLTQDVPQYFTDTNITLLSEAVHFANRHQVTMAVARGNDSAYVRTYPALLDDYWVTTVGGFGSDGFRLSPANGGGGGWTGYRHLDVCGPATYTGNTAPSNCNLVPNTGNGCDNFMGYTSGATPHVTGVMALLMSYMNDTAAAGNYKNLAPEDCEQLVERSATDMAPAGYDSLTGFGRLNAGKALRLVEKPYRDLKHFGTSSTSYSISKQILSMSDTIMLTEAYQNKNSPVDNFPRGKYVVRTYWINATVNHNLPTSDTIKGYWARPSSSETLRHFGANKRLLPHEWDTVTFCNNSSAALNGYIYQVWDTLGTFKGWWPCDTSFSSSSLGPLFEYSILIRNSTPMVGVGINEKSSLGNSVGLFPNPANGQQQLLINTKKPNQVSIELYDMMGRHLKTVYSGKVNSGETVINNDVSTLPNSMYFYTIKLDEEQLTKKFIKD